MCQIHYIVQCVLYTVCSDMTQFCSYLKVVCVCDQIGCVCGWRSLSNKFVIILINLVWYAYEMCEHCETAETERARDRERMEREWERERESGKACALPLDYFRSIALTAGAQKRLNSLRPSWKFIICIEFLSDTNAGSTNTAATVARCRKPKTISVGNPLRRN